MKTQENKGSDNESQSLSNKNSRKQKTNCQTFNIQDNRPNTIIQKKLQEIMNSNLKQLFAPQIRPLDGNIVDKSSNQSLDNSNKINTVQRKINVGGAKVSKYDLSQNLLPLLNDRSKRFLKPIYNNWLKAKKTTYPFQPVATYQSLRSAIINELVDGWRNEMKVNLPNLFGILPEEQFNTLIFMTKLSRGFDPTVLEKSLKTVKEKKEVTKSKIIDAFGPGKLPYNTVNNAIFTTDWTAQVPGVIGVIAELETASGINSSEIMFGQKINMSQDMSLGGLNIGGQATQDADVSFMNMSGENVLIEVAATIHKLRDKMGVNGAQQRARYQRLVVLNDSRVLAYSTPSAAWREFFFGDVGDSIAERLPDLDNGWGLMIDGHYTSPTELLATATIIRSAEPTVPAFWKALKSSGFSYEKVSGMTGESLSKQLQKFG